MRAPTADSIRAGADAPGRLPALLHELERDDRRLLRRRVENARPDDPYASATEHIAQFVYDDNRTAGARHTASRLVPEPFAFYRDLVWSRRYQAP